MRASRGEVVLDRTPFYAESGGQVGDAGDLAGPGVALRGCTDTQKRGAAHAHIGTLTQGAIRVGDALDARVDGERREATALNHSATHILHAALRQVLGTHVLQKVAPLVAPDRLRFDFAHFQAGDTRRAARHRAAGERGRFAPTRRQRHGSSRDYDGAVSRGRHRGLFGEKVTTAATCACSA